MTRSGSVTSELQSNDSRSHTCSLDLAIPWILAVVLVGSLTFVPDRTSWDRVRDALSARHAAASPSASGLAVGVSPIVGQPCDELAMESQASARVVRHHEDDAFVAC